MSLIERLDDLVAGSPSPNLIVGLGAQRCGSSWFNTIMSRHPDVWMCPIKEFRYFLPDTTTDTFRDYIRTRLRKDRRALGRVKPEDPTERSEKLLERIRFLEYVETRLDEAGAAGFYESALTEGAPEGSRVVGETSAAYAGNDVEGLQRIARETPNAIYVLMLRDPVERLWSMGKFIALKKRKNPALLQDRSFLKGILRRDERYSYYSRMLGNIDTAISLDRVVIGYYDEIFRDSAGAEHFIAAVCERTRLPFEASYFSPILEEVEKFNMTDSDPASELAREVFHPLVDDLGQMQAKLRDQIPPWPEEWTQV